MAKQGGNGQARAMAIALTVAAMWVLSACGSSVTSIATSTLAGGTSASSTGTMPTTTTSSPPPVTSGLVFVACPEPGISNGTTVTFVSPTTGKPTAVRRFPLTSSMSTTYGCGRGTVSAPVFPMQTLQDFDNTFSRVAVKDTNSSDSSTHVGYVSSSGTFTDLTHSAGGFSSAPQDSDPVFQPGTDTFWYASDVGFNTNTGELHKVDITSGTDQSQGTVTAPFLVSTVGSILEAPSHPDWSDWAEMAAPDGSAYLDYSDTTGGPDYHLIIGSNIEAVPDQGDAPLCQPAAFVSNSQALCDNLSLANVSQGGIVFTSLLPVTDRTNSEPVLSSDAKSVAFLSQQGSTTGVYTVPISGGQPTEVIADISVTPNLGALTAWIS